MKRILAVLAAIVVSFSAVTQIPISNLDLVSTSSYVPLKPEVLALAKKAYNKRKAEDPTTKSIIMIVDFSYSSDKYRMFIYDIKANTILYRGLVAHGVGSGASKWSLDFSNVNMSKKSSIGLYKIISTYMGKYGRSVRIEGLEKGFNNNAFSRSIVVHPAPYVSDSFVKQYGRVGNSWGCFALDPILAQSVISAIKDGGLLFAYYPDQAWIKTSKYLN